MSAKPALLARSMFGTPVKNWTKGESSPVCEADIAVDRLLHERLTGEGSASAGCRRKASTIRPGSPRATSGSSIRSTARALISRACRIGRYRRRWWRMAGRSWLPLCAGHRRVLHAHRQRRHAQQAAITATTRNRSRKRASPVRRSFLERLATSAPPFTVMPRMHSLALRLARVAQGEYDVAIAGVNSHDWDLAAADLLVHEAGGALTAIGGGTVIYNRPVSRHGMLVAAGRDRHAALVELLRDERLASS